MPFASLVGNEFAKTALLRMHALQRVPNTLLFFGPDGVGKGLFARAFASLLLNAVESSKLSHGNHPDLHIYQPEGKSGMHSIEAMRQVARPKIRKTIGLTQPQLSPIPRSDPSVPSAPR